VPGRPRRRIGLALAVLLVLSLLWGGRLLQVQGLDGARYAAMATRQRLDTVTMTAQRGPIVGRHGHPLAVSVDARDVYADPALVRDPRHTARRLADVLGVGAERLRAKLAADTSFVYLARKVSPRAGTRVLALGLPGVNVLKSSRRVYPEGALASNVIGFAGADGSGRVGLESADNKLLTGRDGEKKFEIGRDGRPIPGGTHLTRPAVRGTGLRLTLDRDIQWKAQQAIRAKVKAAGALRGEVIVMDPHTGEVLAMAVSPGFDPAHPGKHPHALGDPPVTDVYEPGSVNKVITIGAALQRGLVTPNTAVTIPRVLHLAGSAFHDAEPHHTEHLTVTGVLAKSSNVGAAKIAEKLGARRMYHFLRAFGLGAGTGIGLPGESAGLLPSPRAWSATTLPTISFGQGIGVTALQEAQVFATVANGGVQVPPRIVKAHIGPHGRRMPMPPRSPKRVVSKHTAHQLSDMMQAVTTKQGTAPAARIAGYRVAGKTGTANRPDGHGGYSGYTASFIGFAPASDPQLLAEVVVQKPRHGIYGGDVAAPVFHDVMSYALQRWHIAPTNVPPPKLALKAG
jgi:cell division protein FtsI (penicillin-binding protein 3)